MINPYDSFDLETQLNICEKALEKLSAEYKKLLVRVSQAEALLDYYQSEYAGKWVPLSTGNFPKDRQRVYVLGRNQGVHICRFEADKSGGGDFINDRQQRVAFVRSWMPLPPLPGEEES